MGIIFARSLWQTVSANSEGRVDAVTVSSISTARF